MILYFIISICTLTIIEGKHFNGGTINWAPVDSYNNSTSVPITIIQSYSFTYPYISCANNVPISTAGWSGANRNLTCVVGCSTDGGYSTKPIDILTDCTSASASLGMMSSSRSHNVTLNAGAHFYLAYVGSAWAPLNDPSVSGLQWSIVTFIDLRMRPDGFINTPPVTSVVSPQYAFVNQTIQINIPVSDVNVGDDVRCRWSTYTPGYRRRKRSDEEEWTTQPSAIQSVKKIAKDAEIVHIRNKRSCGGCSGGCPQTCSCSCSNCDSATCTGSTCTLSSGCLPGATTIATTTGATTPISITTIDIPGTLQSTSSYPNRQAIDECSGICYPGSVPNGTTLSSCTITFTGLKAGIWYGVAVQVEDFINDTSTVPMSSVPVQFLIHVLPQPACSIQPIIFPLSRCLEVQVGASVSFNLSALNLCNSSVATLSDIVVSSGISGMTNGNLTMSTTNSSVGYIGFTWTPQGNQIGSQQLCIIAYTTEKLQSNQYCVIFTVKNSSDLCVTTTTTTSTTTSTTSTSSSTTTTSVTSTTSTSTSTTTATVTTTTSATSSSSFTTTSTTSTTGSTTTYTTSTSSTPSISTLFISNSTMSTTTSASTIFVTTTTTPTITVTTTTVITATTTTEASKKSIDWALIVGLSLLALVLSVCCACCCLYRFLCFWNRLPAARRRRKENAEKDSVREEKFLSRNPANLTRTQRIPYGKYQPTRASLVDPSSVVMDVEDHSVSPIVYARKSKRAGFKTVNYMQKSNNIKNAYAISVNVDNNNEDSSTGQRSGVTLVRVDGMSNMGETAKTNLSGTQRQVTIPIRRAPNYYEMNRADRSLMKIQAVGNRTTDRDNAMMVAKLSRKPITFE